MSGEAAHSASLFSPGYATMELTHLILRFGGKYPRCGCQKFYRLWGMSDVIPLLVTVDPVAVEAAN